MLSIEPSATLLNEYERKSNFVFPDYTEFRNTDIFDLQPEETGLFDTVFYIHVLEHIENDKGALDHTADLLKPEGHLLIEVPAVPSLFSEHDRMLGHYRRYNKKMLNAIIDTDRYHVVRVWYNDPIGVLGSFFYFKLRGLKLKSNQGAKLVSNQGMIYDKYLIPLQSRIEKLITFPIGLSLTAILRKR